LVAHDGIAILDNVCADWASGAAGTGSAVSTAVVDERLTTIGEQLVPFPVAPRLGKILLVGRNVGVINFAVAVVAALSAQVRSV
jgi:hypothetical protein